ncbi:MAG: SDR family NAD(P)-dependent oxidoreductase [Actinomycetota bacterium]|nr:SDR family NAD(P)-dependent oxidoreductase [Actinomycetota bacterium]
MRKAYSRNLIKLSKLISLKGKKTLITGAGSGIGRAIAKRFAEAGSDLLLLDIDKQSLDKTQELLNHFACIKHSYAIDLTSKKDIDDYWESLGSESSPYTCK